jgi:hypothetical protein
MAPNNAPPAWRRGWTWTVIKCVLANLVAALLGTAGLLWLLRAVLGRLPGWLPASWVRWLFEWMLRHLWFVGPVLGLLVGLLVSLAIVVYDAKRGRLTRLP